MKQPEVKELSKKLQEVAIQIKGLISRSALAKIEIGELLIENKKLIQHGDTKAFYSSIGMSDRTAQHYMRIASNKEVQKLKSEGKLDGLNMSKILEMVGMRVNVRGTNNEDAPQEQQEYKPLGLGKLDFNKCRSTKKFKAEYEMLTGEVAELKKELDALKNKTA